MHVIALVVPGVNCSARAYCYEKRALILLEGFYDIPVGAK
jgi:hypothetical protein